MYRPASAWCCAGHLISLMVIAAAGIVQGLTALEAAGVPPRLLIIDDGWQLTVADSDGQTDGALPEAAAPAKPPPVEEGALQQ